MKRAETIAFGGREGVVRELHTGMRTQAYAYLARDAASGEAVALKTPADRQPARSEGAAADAPAPPSLRGHRVFPRADLAPQPAHRSEALSALVENLRRANPALGYNRPRPLLENDPVGFWRSVALVLLLADIPLVILFLP